ncbi:MAG: hypothetical protein WC441_05020 [Patescibacteria group bacterium]
MNNDDLFDFMIEGGDELLNSELCPECGDAIYLDQDIEWVNEREGICICPHCGKKVKIHP